MQCLRILDELDIYRKTYMTKRKIEDIFLKEGYWYIEPSTFESLYNFIPSINKIKKESMIKVINGGTDVLVLRPDNTTNIIKNFIPRWQDDLTLKLFYNSTVYRNNPHSNIKEIRQVGIEYLGEPSNKADKEVLALALKVFKEFSLKNGGSDKTQGCTPTKNKFLLEVSNSKYIQGLFMDLNIKENEKEYLKNLIFRKNKFGLESYVGSLNLPPRIKNCLLNIFNLQGSIHEIATKTYDNYVNKTMEEGVQDLLYLEGFLKEAGYLDNICFDLSLMTELDYYDGIIFKGYFQNSFKEILSGGRYDSFTMDFGQKVPAIGFSLDLDELVQSANK